MKRVKESERLVVHIGKQFTKRFALLSINLVECFFILFDGFDTIFYSYCFFFFYFDSLFAQISRNGSFDNRMRIKRRVPKNRQHHIFQYQSKKRQQFNSISNSTQVRKTKHFPPLFRMLPSNADSGKTSGKKINCLHKSFSLLLFCCLRIRCTCFPFDRNTNM